MSETQTDFNQTDPNQNQGDPNNGAANWRRQMEQEAATAKAEADAAKAEAESLKRQLAFSGTGLDKSNPTHNFFMTHYKGEPDAEAIKTAATEAGILQAPQNEQQNTIDANARMDAASQNAQASTVSGTDEAKFNELLASADSPEGFNWDAARQAGFISNG